MTNVVDITKAPLKDVSDRKNIIGGSDIGKIICNGQGSYGSQYDVWKSFIGDVVPTNDATKDAFEAGNMLEDAIANWTAKRLGVDTNSVSSLDFMYTDPTDTRLILHPDREFSFRNKRFAIECKTASTYAMRSAKWPEASLLPLPEYPEDFDYEIELYDGNSLLPAYKQQCLWYYALAGYDGVFLSRLTDNRLYVYYVKPDEDEIKDTYNKVKGFIASLDEGFIPRAITSEQALEHHPCAISGSVMTASDTLELNILKYDDLKNQISDLTKEQDEIKAQIIESIGDKEKIINSNNIKIATFGNCSRTGVDSNRLKKECPEVYKKYLKTSVYRSFKTFEH